MITSDEVHDEARPPLIRNSNLRLSNELQRMHASGYFSETDELHISPGWNSSSSAYHHKFDQLAYRLRHFWSWRVILAFFVILFVVNALIVLILTNRDSEEKVSPSFGRFVPLNDFRKRTLAIFKLRRPLLSVDTNNNLIILSSPENRTDELFVEQLALDNFQNGFSRESVKLDGGMRNCLQLSAMVHCCVITEADDTPVDKGTHCFRQKHKGLFDHFYEKKMQMTDVWQTLTNDETVVLLQNRDGEYGILDTKRGTSMPILEDEGNANLKPVAYFFAMDTDEELTELAEGEYKFHVCEYLRDSEHRFLLQECTETALLKLRGYTNVIFCSNPIYQAVIQYDDVYTNTRWQLQVTYVDTNDTVDDNIYTVHSVDFVPNQQIAMVCAPSNIDIYMVSDGVLVHYAIDLPKSDGETLIVDNQLTCTNINQTNLEVKILELLEYSFWERKPARNWLPKEAIIGIVHRCATEMFRLDGPLITARRIRPKNLFVVGSLEGDLVLLVNMLQRYGAPPNSSYIFLGDYIAPAGEFRYDALLLLCCLKLRFTNNIKLLRGHYETYEMSKAMKFDEFCGDEDIFRAFMTLFREMAIAVCADKFLCVHSGVSPYMPNPHGISMLPRLFASNRPCLSDRALITDVLYGYPDPTLDRDFAPSNDFPIGFRFNKQGLKRVLAGFHVKRLIRTCGAHSPSGKYYDFDDEICLTFATGAPRVSENDKRYCIELMHDALVCPCKVYGDDIVSKKEYEQFKWQITYRNLLARWDFRHPRACIVCDWTRGWIPGSATVNHRELADYVREKGIIIAPQFKPDPRMEQYRGAELFPFVFDDFSTDKYKIRPLEYEIDFPLPKHAARRRRPLAIENERLNQTVAVPGDDDGEDDADAESPFTNYRLLPGLDYMKDASSSRRRSQSFSGENIATMRTRTGRIVPRPRRRHGLKYLRFRRVLMPHYLVEDVDNNFIDKDNA